MADKYCDPSLTTGNNDGTSVADAWQNLEQVLKNTMASGSYSAGDTIYIRTHDGTSDITVTLSTGNVQQASIGTESAPVTFVADTGVKWANSGTLTIAKPDHLTYLDRVTNNVWLGDDYNIVFKAETSGDNGRCFRVEGSEGTIRFVGCFFNGTTSANPATALEDYNLEYSTVIFEYCKFYADCDHSTIYPLYAMGKSVYFTFIECVFDFAGVGVSTPFFLKVGDVNSRAFFYGGSAVNNTAGSLLLGVDNDVGVTTAICKVHAVGFDRGTLAPLGNAIDLNRTTEFALPVGEIIEENNAGASSYMQTTRAGEFSWDINGYYPTLDAVLPDASNTPWSLRVRPSLVVNNDRAPFTLFDISKYWNQTAKVLTVTAELLIKDTSVVGGSGNFDNPTVDDWYLEVVYTDNSTGKAVFIRSTKDGSALPTSSAGWTSTTYGADSYNKHSVSLTTASAVKQGSLLYIRLLSTRGTDDASDYYFVDPDVVLE